MSKSMQRHQTEEPRELLARIVDTPGLAHAVPHLQPELLHRIIQHLGLEECGELIALATPTQLRTIVDLDLWKSRRPGLEETLNVDRFGVWLEILADAGAPFAAERVTAMDATLVITALSHYVRVFDPATVAAPVTDGGDVAANPTVDDGVGRTIGGYLVVARREDAWDAIVDVLIALAAEHHDYFHRVMRGCRTLSNAGWERDGLNDLLSDSDQAMFDAAVERERRREKSGYATPAEARAFLEMSRKLRLGDRRAPPRNPLATAYFRAVEGSTDQTPIEAGPAIAALDPITPGEASAVAALVDLLVDSGALPGEPRALLNGDADNPPRLAKIHALLDSTSGDVYASRTQELVYLANVMVAGCSLQSRPFTMQEGYDAAMAVCNLGLENWPAQWLTPDDFVVVFQVGWTILHEHISMFATARLIDILKNLVCSDRDLRAEIKQLRAELVKHKKEGEPWHARQALDVIQSLDMLAWAALVGLLDECPVIHAGITATEKSRQRSVSATAFEFISENQQILAVEAFIASLPDRLRP